MPYRFLLSPVVYMATSASNMILYWKSAENLDVKRLPRNVNTVFPPSPRATT